MKKLLVSPLTGAIHLGNVKDMGGGNFKMADKKEDFTEEAIRSVFEKFLYHMQTDGDKELEAYEIRYTNCPYVLKMIKEPIVEEDPTEI